MTQLQPTGTVPQTALRAGSHRRRLLKASLLALAAALTPAHEGLAAEKVSIQIGAAASLREVMPALLDAYLAQGKFDVKIDVSFSSSGNLSRQIQQGAPFDLFMSANKAMIDRLDVANEQNVKPYASGRLALVTNRSTAQLAKLNTAGEESWVTAVERIQRWADLSDIGLRLVIANPQHAPYGVAAEQALQRQNLFARLRPRTLTGENASQAVQFLLNGGATFGIVSQSLLVNNARLNDRLWMQAIPASDHAPIDHSMIVLSPHKEVANDMMTFFTTDATATIWRAYGFDAP